MEKPSNTPLLEREAIIQAAYAEKKGRESFGPNPFTCYVRINSPRPDLAGLTASLIEELATKKSEAYIWTKEWDKSVVSVAPSRVTGCVLLAADDPKGKLMVPVSTTKAMVTAEMMARMPEGEIATIGINEVPMTIDAFLITYFHLVNELIWDVAMTQSGGTRVNARGYGLAVDLVSARGFSVGLVSEEQMLEIKKAEPRTTMRIYGSKVNKFVPQIMGIVINK